jgi:hypothetical protein
LLRARTVGLLIYAHSIPRLSRSLVILWSMRYFQLHTCVWLETAASASSRLLVPVKLPITLIVRPPAASRLGSSTRNQKIPDLESVKTATARRQLTINPLAWTLLTRH